MYSILLAHFGLDTVVKHDFHNFYLTYVYPVPILKIMVNVEIIIENYMKEYLNIKHI